MKRGSFKFRVTDTLREKLTKAAQLNGRPISEEIELRLELSFHEQGMREIAREEIRAWTVILSESVVDVIDGVPVVTN